MGTNKNRTDRLYLRLKPELKVKVQAYCKRNHLVLSDVVTRFFVRLLQKEQEDKHVDAEQI
jgi:hypothetical protein